MSDFGARFRKARESAGLSIEEVAMETRIRSRFVKAIEDEEFDLLPGGIFNRSFVRSYADHLDMDPESAVAGYERARTLHPPTEPVRRKLSHPSPPDAKGPLYPIVLATLALLLAIFFVATAGSAKW